MWVALDIAVTSITMKISVQQHRCGPPQRQIARSRPKTPDTRAAMDQNIWKREAAAPPDRNAHRPEAEAIITNTNLA
jgi:hypothetical protein